MLNFRFVRLLFWVLLILLPCSISGQIFVVTDRDFCSPGETIQLRSFELNPSPEVPNHDSLHIVLQNFRGEGIIHQQYAILDHSAHGALLLPDDLPYGMYTLKAITQSQLATGQATGYSRKLIIRNPRIAPFKLNLSCEDSLYQRGEVANILVELRNLKGKLIRNYPLEYSVSKNGVIQNLETVLTDKKGKAIIQIPLDQSDSFSIVSITISAEYKGGYVSKSLVVPTSDWPVLVSIYPEGGNLIEHQSSKMVISTRNTLGYPVGVPIQIYDDNDHMIQKIETDAQGLTSFEYVPDLGNPYYLKLESPGIQVNEFELPEIIEQGLQVKRLPSHESQLIFRLNPVFESSDPAAITVLAFCGNTICYTRDLKLDSAFELRVLTDSLPVGLIQFNFYSAQKTLLAQRPVFISHPQPQLNAQLSLPDGAFAMEGHIELNQHTGPSMAIPTSMSYSLVDDFFNSSTPLNPDIVWYDLLGKQAENAFLNPVFDCIEPNFDPHTMDLFSQTCLDPTTGASKETYRNPAMEMKAQHKLKSYLEGEQIAPLVQLAAIIKCEKYLSECLENHPDIDHFVSLNRHKLQNWGFFPRPLTKEEQAQKLLERGTPVLSVISQIKAFRRSGNYLFFKPVNSFSNSVPALIMIDGIEMGYSIEALLDLVPQNIKSIKVYTSVSDILRYTGVTEPSGIIVIERKNGDSLDTIVENPLDHYNPVINWKAVLVIPGFPQQIQFDYPKLKTRYQISLQGLDNKGKPIAVKTISEFK